MSDKHVLFYQGRNPMEAHMLAGLLEEHGLEPLIEQEDVSTVFGGMSPVDQGVRILIKESERSEALKVMRDVETEARFYGADDMGGDSPREGARDAGPSPMRIALKIGKYPLVLWQILGIIAAVAIAAWFVFTFYAGTDPFFFLGD